MKRLMIPCRVRNLGGHFRKYVTQPEVELYPRLDSALRYLQLDERVSKAIDEEHLSPKRHPGVMKSNVEALPTTMKEAIDLALEGCNKHDIAKEGEGLCRKLLGRVIVKEEREIKHILNEQRTKILNSVDTQSLLPEEQKRLADVCESLSNKKLKKLVQPWKPLDTSLKTSLMYLVSRTPAEFVILHKIFSEIYIRDPDFIPETFFDFGSGVASGYWAVREVWEKPLTESFHVDVNPIMNDLARALIQQNKNDSDSTKGVFFRQFFPSAPEPTYDLVLSGFSLFELPSMKDRLESIIKLWQKTNKYLVIVEDGTIAGFNLIMEARNLLLGLQNDIEGQSDFHVFAPCPHDIGCPALIAGNRPCNYQIKYFTLPYLSNSQVLKTHTYSYVIFKKGRNLENPEWSRLVRKPIQKSRFYQCYVCTPNGTLRNVIITKAKSDKNAYRCSKYTSWGDFLPGKLFESEEDRNANQH